MKITNENEIDSPTYRLVMERLDQLGLERETIMSIRDIATRLRNVEDLAEWIDAINADTARRRRRLEQRRRERANNASRASVSSNETVVRQGQKRRKSSDEQQESSGMAKLAKRQRRDFKFYHYR